MRRGTQLLLVFLVSAVVAIGAATLAGVHLGGNRDPSPWLGASRPSTESNTTAQQAAASGRLREAQDEYLSILLDHPDNAAAMRGLVSVRRQLANDDPVVLRRQAAAYQQMAASGVEPPEHYSKRAMEMLASASLRAASAVEFEQRSTAQRTNGPAPSDVPRSAPAPDRGTIAAPVLPGAPGQTDKVNAPGTGSAQPAPPGSQNQSAPSASGTTPPQAGAPPAPPKAPAQGPAVPAPAPQTPPPPSTGAAPPPGSGAGQTAVPPGPAGGQTAPPPSSPPAPPADSSEGTVAVVPPASGGPAPAQVEGSLAKVDCQRKTFVLNNPNGDEEFLAAPNFTIYIRGASSERLADFCALQRHVGRTAMVWWVPDGGRKIAKSMSVVLPTQ